MLCIIVIILNKNGYPILVVGLFLHASYFQQPLITRPFLLYVCGDICYMHIYLAVKEEILINFRE